MINILLSGCNGKMGQVISRLATEKEGLVIAAGFDMNTSIQSNYPVYSDLKKCDKKIDVIIDFSHPSVLEGLLEFAVSKKIPAVIATTGLSSSQVKKLKDVSEIIPIFFSANMSLGVNLLIDLVKKAARVLERDFDIEIVEKHHNQKIDAPSGTALAIADAINSVCESEKEYTYDRHSRRKKRGKNEIGIHAVREIIEINHIAMSKEIFAEGSLNAAMFLHDKKPGMYNMNDLIQSK